MKLSTLTKNKAHVNFYSKSRFLFEMPKRKAAKPRQNLPPKNKEQLTVQQIETDHINEVKA